MKKLNFEIFSQNFSQKNQNIQQYFLSSKMKSTVLFLTIFTFLSKIDENSGKNFGKCE